MMKHTCEHDKYVSRLVLSSVCVHANVRGVHDLEDLLGVRFRLWVHELSGSVTNRFQKVQSLSFENRQMHADVDEI